MTLHSLLFALLRLFAQGILRIYEPTIIGVTGSVGKTSTKQAMHAVLAGRFPVRTNLKNYNNELGVPLTIIGAETAGKSLLGWARVFLRATRLLFFRDESYPKMLVIEMGADHPGDIAYLTRLAPCAVGVLTAVAPAHTEFFGSVEAVLKEKSHIVTHLPSNGCAVLNADDARVSKLASASPAPALTFGFSEESTVRALDIALSFDNHHVQLVGSTMTVRYEGAEQKIILPGVVGRHQAYPPLAAICVGIHFGMDLAACAAALRNYRPPAGRMNLLAGIKNTVLIDDSYNSSPVALHAALETLMTFPNAQRRIACLGDMAELGALSDDAHREVGESIAAQPVDLLITVGAKGRKIGDAAIAKGFSTDKVFAFDFSPEAGKFLQDRLDEGDVVLIKGSQVSRMEKITKEVMAEPEKASELLVRQGAEWVKQ